MTSQVATYSETEEKIFEAALDVFSKKGKDGTRMHEISSAAGINSALLHYYFGNKDELYGAVLTYAARRFVESFAESFEDAATFADVLRSFIAGYIDFGASHLNIIRMIMGDALCGGTTITPILKEMKASPDAPPGLFLIAIDKAMKAGEIREVDAEQTMVTVISSCVHFLVMLPMLNHLFPSASNQDAFIEARKSHLFDLFYHGLKPGEAS